jgi:cytochrome c553
MYKPKQSIGFAGALCVALAAMSGAAGADGSLKAGNQKAAMCAACHGKDGLSRRPDVPHIAGQSEIYLQAQLHRFRSGERIHPEMNVVAKNLSDEDIGDLVAWYSSIQIEVKLPQ